MFNDVSDKQKARANLILASIAVILIIHGDGKFNGSSFLGGSITFGEELALPITGSAMFVYFVWRFLLSSGDAIRDFLWDINLYFYNTDTYHDIACEWLLAHKLDVEYVQSFIDQSVFNLSKKMKSPTRDFRGKPPVHIYKLQIPLILRFSIEEEYFQSFKPYRFYVWGPEYLNRPKDLPHYTYSGDETSEPRKILKIVDRVTVKKSFQFIGVYIISFFKAVFIKRSFTDLVLPFLMGYYATVLLAYTVTTYLLST